MDIVITKKNRDKGGGSRKYGQNEKKCRAYRMRDSVGQTKKCRNIARILKNGGTCVGWFLTENGRAMREKGQQKKVVRRRATA